MRSPIKQIVEALTDWLDKHPTPPYVALRGRWRPTEANKAESFCNHYGDFLPPVGQYWTCNLCGKEFQRIQ
jgi:hypothetical protein